MKYLIPLVILVFTTSTSGKIIASTTGLPLQKCAFNCPNSDWTLCATNGQCMQEFQGECQMSSHNCAHPHKPFVIIEDYKCKQSGAPKCAQKDVQLY